jgi:alpha-1,3-mannosyltransferase
MGNPKQELFIHNHLAETGCVLGIGVGALFDFLAGNVPRATPWVQKRRLEWVYRLAQEPRRLAGRYLVGNLLFLARIMKQWWSGARVTDAGAGLAARAPAILPAQNAATARKTAVPAAVSA